MIKALRLKNFKSWADTERIRFAPITGFFGPNSSGKTAILQALLMLKQTVDSSDPTRALHTGDENSLVDLGIFSDLIRDHRETEELEITLEWAKDVKFERFGVKELRLKNPTFTTAIKQEGDKPVVTRLRYDFHNKSRYSFEMIRKADSDYEFRSEGYTLEKRVGRPSKIPSPIKCYGFPFEVEFNYKNFFFTFPLNYTFERLFKTFAYLGPLREYPRRIYRWGGDEPHDVGKRGELAVSALLASRKWGKVIKASGRKKVSVEEKVAEWFKELGIIHEFSLKPISKNRKEYDLKIQVTPESPEVFITDVGFGISQVLPVIVLSYYRENSIVFLEQPEIHLHPRIQAGLADVLIGATKDRGTQIVLESHSEHLLRRLQRRIAEGEIKAEDLALYFCDIENGVSRLTPLDVDLYGNIKNWPKNFFGDEMGDVAAQTKAAMERKKNEDKKK